MKKQATTTHSVLPIAFLLIWSIICPGVLLEQAQADDATTGTAADILPQWTHYEEPTYPRSARKRGQEGIVWISALVDAAGEVEDAVVQQSSGHDRLDKEALKSAKKCKYLPAQEKGQPAPAWVLYKVEFSRQRQKNDERTAEPEIIVLPTVPEEERYYPTKDEMIMPDVICEMIHNEPPSYPRSAEKSGAQGLVWIKCLVDYDGSVMKAFVFCSSGNRTLDDAALEVAPKCLFKPAMKDGRPIAMWVTYKVKFSLQGR